MAREKKLVDKVQALAMAREIGCSGAHLSADGNWMPCETMEEMERISNIAETSKWRTVVPGYSPKKKRETGKRKRKRNEWENLREAPIMGIATLPGGGLVSGNSFSGKSVGPEYVRETDVDVFLDPESARARSRQLGCIGISRRVSKNGRSVWMPCSNMTDYANTSGSTALGRRNISKRRADETREAVRVILTDGRNKPIKRKSAISDELRHK
jgi:hypothetical protein